MQVHVLPALSDNYIFVLMKDDKTAVVDPGEAGPVIDFLTKEERKLDLILNTHHHGDHIAGNAALIKKYGAQLVGPRAEKSRISGMKKTVGEGDVVKFAGSRARVFETPGHTTGHIAFHFAEDGVLFCGDTLFALGCGRVFEGTPAQMWESLKKLRSLPDETMCYCGHEYTQGNAGFASSIEPKNAALKRRVVDILRTRSQGLATIPFQLGEDKATNPFLRADSPDLQAAIGMAGADPADVFAQIRAQKDAF